MYYNSVPGWAGLQVAYVETLSGFSVMGQHGYLYLVLLTQCPVGPVLKKNPVFMYLSTVANVL